MTRAKATPARPWERAKSTRRVLTRDPEWAATAIAALIGSCHAKQADAVDDPARLISLLVGRGGGKSTGALAKLFRRMMRRKRARCLFLALTKDSAARIIWEEAKATLDNLGVEYTASEARKVIRLTKNGSTLELGGCDDLHEIDKYRGVTFHAAVIDEGAAYSPKLLAMLIDEVLVPRLDGWLMLIGTAGRKPAGPFFEATAPGSKYHRPYADRDKPEWRGVVRKWSSHRWTLEDGAKEVEAIASLWAEALRTKEVEGWTDTNPKWLREYMAVWAADDTDMVYKYRPVVDQEMARERGLPIGAAWNRWEPAKVSPLGLAELPAPEAGDAWRYVYAFDKGLSGAFAVDAFAFQAKDPRRRIRHVYGFTSPTIMTARDLARQLLGTRDGDATSPRPASQPRGLIGATGWPAGIVGDADEVFLKELADVYGIAARKADRRQDQKATGIEEVNSDLYDGRILVLAGSNLEEQLTHLQWKRDEFNVPAEDKGQPNHSTDNLVNARKLIARQFEAGGEPPPATGHRGRGEDDDRPRERGWTSQADDGDDGGWTSADDSEWDDLTPFAGRGRSRT